MGAIAVRAFKHMGTDYFTGGAVKLDEKQLAALSEAGLVILEAKPPLEDEPPTSAPTPEAVPARKGRPAAKPDPAGAQE